MRNHDAVINAEALIRLVARPAAVARHEGHHLLEARVAADAADDEDRGGAGVGHGALGDFDEHGEEVFLEGVAQVAGGEVGGGGGFGLRGRDDGGGGGGDVVVGVGSCGVLLGAVWGVGAAGWVRVRVRVWLGGIGGCSVVGGGGRDGFVLCGGGVVRSVCVCSGDSVCGFVGTVLCRCFC